MSGKCADAATIALLIRSVSPTDSATIRSMTVTVTPAITSSMGSVSPMKSLKSVTSSALITLSASPIVSVTIR